MSGSREELEKEVEKSLNRLGIHKSDDEFSELRNRLADILSDRENARRFSSWAEDSGSVLKEKVDDHVEGEKRKLREQHEEEERGLIKSTMRDALSSGILSIDDETAVGVLDRVRDGAGLQTLKRELDFDAEKIRNRVQWLETLGVIERNQAEESSEENIYKVSATGSKLLEEKAMCNSFPGWSEQLYCIAFAATGSDKSAEKLLNRLFGRWGEEHGSVLEKLDKRFEEPLEKMSRYFWEKMEGGHSKHLGVRIKDHEAGGMLLTLRISSLHVEKGVPENGDVAGTRIFGKSNMRGQRQVQPESTGHAVL